MKGTHSRLSANGKEGLFYLLALVLTPLLYIGIVVVRVQGDTAAFMGMKQYIRLFLNDPLFIRTLVNSYVLPVCCIIPIACLCMWGAKRLRNASVKVQLLVTILVALLAVVMIAAGCMMTWYQQKTVFSMAMVLAGGGLLFLPFRLLGDRLKQQHGIFRPFFQLLAACIAALPFYLPGYLASLRDCLIKPEYAVLEEALGHSMRPSVTVGQLAGLFYCALIICLLTWCAAALYRLAVRKKQ